MSYNGSGTFNINSTGQPVVAGTVITASAFNALTTDLATGLTTAITKDGQTTTTARITFAQGITSSLVTDSSSVSTGSIITAGGAGIAKNLYVGVNANVAGTLGVTGVATFRAAPIYSSLTASSAVATDASKGLVSVTNTGTGNNVLGTSPTIATPTITGDATISGLTVGKGGGASVTNTATGYLALASNSSGTQNSAFGNGALNTNSSGANNTAIGYYAQVFNTTGGNNTSLGVQALQANTTASNNTAVGYQAGYTNVLGTNNTFIGYGAGHTSNAATTTGYNTAVGAYAGYGLTTGTRNTFIGSFQSGGTAGSGSAVTTGSANSILGAYTGNAGGLDIRTASNYIVLSDGDGNPRGYFNGSGHPFFPALRNSAGLYAARFNGSLELTVDTSSARYKDNIRDSIYGLADLLKIQSRQFEYKDDGRSDVGFIAEEMVEVIPEVVAIDKQGRPDAVSYDRLVSVCVKAIQELKTIVDAQAAEIAELKAK